MNTFVWLSIGHWLADTNWLVSIDRLLFRSSIFIDWLRPEINYAPLLKLSYSTVPWISVIFLLQACAPRYIYRGVPITTKDGDLHFRWLLGRCFRLTSDLQGVAQSGGILDPCLEGKVSNTHGSFQRISVQKAFKSLWKFGFSFKENLWFSLANQLTLQQKID